MALSPLAGKPAPTDLLVDVVRLEEEYRTRKVDPENHDQRVSFGTSGHRGTPLRGTFTEAHILAITQAICDYRRRQGINGPLYMGKDTHALSRPAQATALEVLAANGVETVIQRADGVTPTPVISRAILVHNRGRTQRLADGIVVTPSHNPPEDGGFKYNPPNGGPADTDVTRWIENRANELLRAGQPRREAHAARQRHARPRPRTQDDFVLPYVEDLRNVIDMDVDPRRRLEARRRSAGRRRGALLGADQRRLRARHHGREPDGRSDLRVHDGRSRRQDSHGLLEPVRDGAAGGAQGPVPASPSATTPTPTATASSRRPPA